MDIQGSIDLIVPIGRMICSNEFTINIYYELSILQRDTIIYLFNNRLSYDLINISTNYSIYLFYL